MTQTMTKGSIEQKTGRRKVYTHIYKLVLQYYKWTTYAIKGFPLENLFNIHLVHKKDLSKMCFRLQAINNNCKCHQQLTELMIDSFDQEKTKLSICNV